MTSCSSMSVSECLTGVLIGLGVSHAFGVIGGAVAPFALALSRSPIRYVHCCHEGGAIFAAVEASLATGRPAVVFTTTGPGLANVINGLLAARWEGARVIVDGRVVGSSPVDDLHLFEGTHHLKVTLGDAVWQQSFVLRSEQSLRYDVELKPTNGG